MLKFFIEDRFTTSEMHEIAEAFNKPSVQKYLIHLAKLNTVEIATTPQDKTPDSEYIRKQEQLRGGIAMVETLLSIQTAPGPQQ